MKIGLTRSFDKIMRLQKAISLNKWFILAVVSIILGFIWFEVRPMIIRQQCQENAREAGSQWWGYEFTENIADPVRKSQLQQEYSEGFYNRCLHDKGLGK